MSKERYTTKHPLGKQGVNIDKDKYEIMRKAIIQTLEKNGSLTFSQLNQMVRKKIKADFEGSVSWYLTTVKLDLEARNLIKRDNTSSPQKISLVK